MNQDNSTPFGYPTNPKDVDKLQDFDTPEKLQMNSANEYAMGLNIAKDVMRINIVKRTIEQLKEQKYLSNENANNEYIDMLIKEFKTNKVAGQITDQIMKRSANEGMTMIKNEIVDELTDEAVNGVLEAFRQKTDDFKKELNIQ